MSSKAKKLSKTLAEKEVMQETKNIADNLIMMGHCQCGAPIFSYIDVADSNGRYDMYCMGKLCGYVSDIRFPRQKDQMLMKHPHSPMEILIEAYKQKGVDISKEIETAPQSENVGKYLAPEHGKTLKECAEADKAAIKEIKEARKNEQRR